MKRTNDCTDEGQRSSEESRDTLVDEDNIRGVCEEETAKKELWLQLADARQSAGLTQAELAQRIGISQAQVARIEKRGYDCYTLNTLRKYVEALGDGFTLEVRVHHHHDLDHDLVPPAHRSENGNLGCPSS